MATEQQPSVASEDRAGDADDRLLDLGRLRVLAPALARGHARREEDEVPLAQGHCRPFTRRAKPVRSPSSNDRQRLTVWNHFRRCCLSASCAACGPTISARDPAEGLVRSASAAYSERKSSTSGGRVVSHTRCSSGGWLTRMGPTVA